MINLTVERLKEIKSQLKKGKLVINDRYKETNQSKVENGFTSYGDIIYGYEYNPDVFIKSDVSGMLCRYYIVVDGLIMHPDEIYRVKVNKDTNQVVLNQERIKVQTNDINNYRARSYSSLDKAISEVTCWLKCNDKKFTLSNGSSSLTLTIGEWKQIDNDMYKNINLTFNDLLNRFESEVTTL